MTRYCYLRVDRMTPTDDGRMVLEQMDSDDKYAELVCYVHDNAKVKAGSLVEIELSRNNQRVGMYVRTVRYRALTEEPGLELFTL